MPPVPAAVDPDTLTSLLDGRWAGLRADIRAEMAAAPYRDPIDLSVEEHRSRVFDQLTALAANDRAGLGFDKAYGGGSDIGGSVVSFEMLGFGDLSLMVKAGVQWGLFGGAVQLLGTAPHHERYLRRIRDLDLLGCFAMTEHGHGSDVQHLRTTATYDPDSGEFVVHTPDRGATKEYIGNAARDGRVAVVFAQLTTQGETRGVHAFVVPIRDDAGAPAPGVTIEDCGPKAGLNGVDNGRLSFDQVRIPREALLNRFGDVAPDGTYSSPIEGDARRFFTMLGTLIRGRVSVGGSAGSATKRALALAVRYAELRRQFATPDGEEVVILDYLGHQRKLLPALATSYALHFAQEELVAALHDITDDAPEQEQRELESRAAGLKVANTWHATAAIQAAREACGGAGYLAENLLPGLKADTDVFTTFEGDNTVLLQLVAKGLLTEYKDAFQNLSPLATVRFAAERVLGAVAERTSARKVVDRLTDGDDREALFDRDWQLKLFEDREQHVLGGVADRLRKAAQDPFGVFNAAQDHVLRAGRVHVDRLVLEAFVRAIARCTDPDAKALLERVCDLYALANIEADRAWFLEHGRLSTGRSKAVIAAVNTLCGELRPHARTLVDAFAIPEQYLAAPMLS
ncbi:acyl-CoA oxidase domain protein [Catenulispora acidiphila DSM 44928]|uniref:acyl-CoA oxidase n=1 Tax=Catenulispora acidiphila (strain DSM 44928 / JCM 14897 / NBRC 102108 / NRRL B-24433 / ID139908) TaxID=479433 RepID=C7Q7S7_CATAD|nr:acyl-CoA dehydrogenase [Catenulispora acidiphila]ACU72270.1 acyl-CoA oxidase domain protein [Catenulispora acidiphila DSM 44928]